MTELGLFSRLFFIEMDRTNIFKKKSNFLIYLLVSLFIIAIIFVLIFFSIKIYNSYLQKNPSIRTIIKKWNQYDYAEVYDITQQKLQDNPFNNSVLIYHGYAAFYLAVSQLDSASAQNYLDDSINSLRLALINPKRSQIGQLQYVLGKAYFYKNTITSYYYSDLAVKYLEKAKENGYKSNDIAEYLGLSYASLGMTLESISSFTEALLVRESDTLLLSIAEQYVKSGQGSVAKQYLFRIINNSENNDLVYKSMILLGTVYIEEKDYKTAKELFDEILQKYQNSADAYYGLGVIYEKQGDLIKARAEWRRALKCQINHAPSMAKMSDYN